jgi:hypothetical protein
MKHIFKTLLMPALVLPLLFAACSEDRDSNPTLNLSHATDQFTLNMPGNAVNNTYDLINAENIILTCNQPNYGGVPYVTRYFAQVAFNENDFASGTFKELMSSSTDASNIAVSASELNDALVDLFKEANPDAAFQSVPRSIAIRLRAIMDATGKGETFSNIITLPSVLATYITPPATLPTQIFVVGSSIQDAWSSWKPLTPVFGLSGEFFTMVYFPANGEFKWGLENGDWRGYDRIKTIEDNAGAGISQGDGGNIKVANAGWYVFHFACEIVDNAQQYTLKVEPGVAGIIGACTADPDWKDIYLFTTPADNSIWESPAFTGSGELRAYVKVPGFDWWRTEFTMYKGETVYYRDFDIPSDWQAGAAEKANPPKEDPENYSQTVGAGKTLTVNFDNNTGSIE